MNDEGQVKIGGEFEETPTDGEQRFDVCLNHGGLNFQAIEGILRVELA